MLSGGLGKAGVNSRLHSVTVCVNNALCHSFLVILSLLLSLAHALSATLSYSYSLCYSLLLILSLYLSLTLSLSLSLDRTALCQALVTSASTQDRSPALLQTLTSSLLSSFSPYEVTTAGGKQICAVALLKVAALARAGLIDRSYRTSQLLSDLISAYTILNNGSQANSAISRTQYPVTTAVSLTYTETVFSFPWIRILTLIVIVH